MRRRILFILLILIPLFLGGMPRPACADSNGQILRGVGRIIAAPFQIPGAMLNDSKRVMFPFGIVTGAISGTFQTVMQTVAGTLDIAQGAAPYAKYAIFLV